MYVYDGVISSNHLLHQSPPSPTLPLLALTRNQRVTLYTPNPVMCVFPSFSFFFFFHSEHESLLTLLNLSFRGFFSFFF